MPTKRDSERYEIDTVDGLRRGIVGDWAPEKHLRLQRYVDISRAARRKFNGSSSYIDLYCGPGRARVKNTQDVADGSALIAASEAAKRVPFGNIIVGDIDPVNVDACRSRLNRAGFTNVQAHVGAAEDVAVEVASKLRPGLNLAFLDPYNIEALPFSVIDTLGKVPHMDMIIHVSVMDLQRNVRSMMANGKLDRFAPGWQEHVNRAETNPNLVLGVFAHWRNLITSLGQGYEVSSNVESVRGARNQPLYWLVLAAQHPLADQFWTEVSQVEPQMRMPI